MNDCIVIVFLHGLLILLLGVCDVKEEEWEAAVGTYRLHHIKLLLVLHLVDLVDVLHRRLVEVHPLLVQEFIGLSWVLEKKE